jgi:hypothetical protein
VAKEPIDMTLRELAQEMCKRPDSLDHLTAKAEMERRRTEAQLRATGYMLASSIAAAVSATGSAVAAGVACYLAFQVGP